MMRTGVVAMRRLRHSNKVTDEVVVPLTPRLLSDDMVGLKQAEIAGLGIVALPGYVCRHEVRSGALRRVFRVGRPLTRSSSAHRPELARHRVERDLYSFFAPFLGSSAQWPAGLHEPAPQRP